MNSKNVSWDPATDAVRGLKSSHPASAAEIASLGAMMARFARFGEELFASLLGKYTERLTTARTSFRPIEIEGRKSRTVGSNDALLHIDSFSSRPMAKQRILRIFTNVNPGDRPRVWNVGESFGNVAARFAPQLSKPWPGQRAAMRALRITKSYRTLYDHYMLRMQKILGGNPDVHWMAASLRRTPGDLLAVLDRLGAPNLSTFAVKDVDVDWLPGKLESAATVWVTEDSVSMIHEAITAGAATGLLAVPRLTPPDASATRWFEQGIGTLLADSLVTSFSDWNAGRSLTPPAKPLDEAQHCADWILQEWIRTPR